MLRRAKEGVTTIVAASLGRGVVAAAVPGGRFVLGLLGLTALRRQSAMITM